MAKKFSHATIEKNSILLLVLTLIVVAIGGLVEIVPTFLIKSTIEDVKGVRPYSPLELAGRNIYIREGCHVCHTQMVRPLRAETERYGAYSVAGEDVWEHPFLWGSKRTGPDLARVGLRPITEQWHREHLRDPRQVVPESNMPAYPWLQHAEVDWSYMKRTLTVFQQQFGVPYSDQDIDQQMAKVAGEWAEASEEDALVAYLLSLGQARREQRQ